MTDEQHKRLDQWLVERGLAPSRTKAQDLIRDGLVSVGGVVMTTPAKKILQDELDGLQLSPTDMLKYVSRAGLKLEAAVKEFSVDVQGKSVLDIGSSTGGFIDMLLQAGVDKVIGVDVGHDQLHASLEEYAKSHPQKLVNFEGVNARQLSDCQPFVDAAEGGFDLIVIDVSFISMTQVLEQGLGFLKPAGELLALVKPQFELSSGSLNKKGVVKNLDDYGKVEKKMFEKCQSLNLQVIGYGPSAIVGKDGNQEFFLYAKNQGAKK